MSVVTAPIKIKTYQAAILRTERREPAYDPLRILWRRIWLIAALLIAALCLGLVVLVLMGPRYTADAMISLDFSRDQPVTGERSQPIATVDAAAVVDSVARIIRSRATANSVVTRLQLDKDPAYSSQSALGTMLSTARVMLGLERETLVPSPRDLAVTELMRQIAVTNEARSYVISIAATSPDPDQAAKLANTVALEYLRSQMLQQLTDAQTTAARDLATVSAVYGVRHPSYLRARAKLEELNTRLVSLRNGLSVDELTKLGMRQSFIAADKVLVPSSPSVRLILGIALGGALAAGVGLALRLR